MKYSLGSLMIVAILAPPLLGLACVHPPVAGATLLVFLPLLLMAKYRLWWLFSCNAFGWGLYGLFGIPKQLNMYVPPLVFLAFCLAFYAVIPLFNACHRRREASLS
jgi:hypothetical protein